MTESATLDLAERLRRRIRDVLDFPRPGIVFKDITPVLGDRALYAAVIDDLAAAHAGQPVDHVVGIESRGFLFAAPLALRLGAGFVPVRKPGKLPYHTIRIEYELEYGTDALEAHEDAIRPGDRVLIVDDLLATGGTATAAARLVERLGGTVVGASFVVELGFLNGRERLGDVPVRAIVAF
ncbi:MAG TPA: adenine phosphoribosyltransferase [Longimicrobiales bacterium]